MNDSILRGFCQHLNCTLPVQFMLNEKKWVHRDQTFMYFDHDADGVGFLSPKQIEIISDSTELFNFAMNRGEHEVYPTLAQFLRENPFLVASILKDAGEKELISK